MNHIHSIKNITNGTYKIGNSNSSIPYFVLCRDTLIQKCFFPGTVLVS